MQLLDALDFHDHQVLDHEVDAIVADLAAFVYRGDSNLSRVPEMSCVEFRRQGGSIHRLIQSRPQDPVHFNSAADDLFSRSIDLLHVGVAVSWLHLCAPLCSSSVSSCYLCVLSIEKHRSAASRSAAAINGNVASTRSNSSLFS